MPWPIRYHQARPEKLQPGDMFPAPWILRDSLKQILTPKYWATHAPNRPPLVLRLPNGHDFCIDAKDRERGHSGDGWDVTGEPPNITMAPSIDDARGKPYGYHGHLENGILSDDVEGRQFG